MGVVIAEAMLSPSLAPRGLKQACQRTELIPEGITAIACFGQICRSIIRIGSPSSDPEMLGEDTSADDSHYSTVLLDGRREISRLARRLVHWTRSSQSTLRHSSQVQDVH